MNRAEKYIIDNELASSCGCCLCCDKYKTVKEQNKLCEVRKARKRVINRDIYRIKRGKK